MPCEVGCQTSFQIDGGNAFAWSQQSFADHQQFASLEKEIMILITEQLQKWSRTMTSMCIQRFIALHTEIFNDIMCNSTSSKIEVAMRRHHLGSSRASSSRSSSRRISHVGQTAVQTNQPVSATQSNTGPQSQCGAPQTFALNSSDDEENDEGIPVLPPKNVWKRDARQSHGLMQVTRGRGGYPCSGHASSSSMDVPKGASNAAARSATPTMPEATPKVQAVQGASHLSSGSQRLLNNLIRVRRKSDSVLVSSRSSSMVSSRSLSGKSSGRSSSQRFRNQERIAYHSRGPKNRNSEEHASGRHVWTLPSSLNASSSKRSPTTGNSSKSRSKDGMERDTNGDPHSSSSEDLDHANHEIKRGRSQSAVVIGTNEDVPDFLRSWGWTYKDLEAARADRMEQCLWRGDLPNEIIPYMEGLIE
eukprot:gnl/MRDRNA2_/MRDRNA2_77307_c0_seq1.p1 gnl/MRDRNA2_/MRDRNA2_77307_c0~~gnl/MRDRNA2_/MRDRNA2_77307_c0_seq1.p1  ORF type:complete len:418 (+),score=48.02 gnl/MRDRNA2_/MRDRNA2_77307_c0_seq1:63-1316(+)